MDADDAAPQRGGSVQVRLRSGRNAVMFPVNVPRAAYRVPDRLASVAKLLPSAGIVSSSSNGPRIKAKIWMFIGVTAPHVLICGHMR